MAKYLARRIREGNLIYEKVFAIPRWKKYQDETDALLVEEGREDLIVR